MQPDYRASHRLPPPFRDPAPCDEALWTPQSRSCLQERRGALALRKSACALCPAAACTKTFKRVPIMLLSGLTWEPVAQKFSDPVALVLLRSVRGRTLFSASR